MDAQLTVLEPKPGLEVHRLRIKVYLQKESAIDRDWYFKLKEYLTAKALKEWEERLDQINDIEDMLLMAPLNDTVSWRMSIDLSGKYRQLHDQVDQARKIDHWSYENLTGF